LQFVLEHEPPRVDFVMGQGMKHEGIVWIRTVANGNDLLLHARNSQKLRLARAATRGLFTVSFYAANRAQPTGTPH
jgi:hypothetical protein